MVTLDLSGSWRMRDASSQQWFPASVPGSVYNDLLAAGQVPDPFWRDNEDKILGFFEPDYVYEHDFTVDNALLAQDRVLLHFDGLDTICDVELNDAAVGSASNMHRVYEWDVKGLLRAGQNTLRVRLNSSLRYLQENPSQVPSLLGGFAVNGIRKAQCAYGWDWGMTLPDAGIWRPVSLRSCSTARLTAVRALQHHGEGAVELELIADVEQWGRAELTVDFLVTAPDGAMLAAKAVVVGGKAAAHLTVESPQIWWPHGYGEQPLYTVQATLAAGGPALQQDTQRIGLRTIRLRREPDAFGRSYEFVVNGVALYLMGSNLIIQDSVLGRAGDKETERLLRNTLKANMNCIRVWGGAHFPHEYFYDRCDELGILIYQDFMFACTLYPADAAFLDNVRQEIADAVNRLRHHACIALWCGNNEIELVSTMLTGTDEVMVKFREALSIPDMSAHASLFQEGYAKLFFQLIPEVVRELDPERDYVSSSPSVHPDDWNKPMALQPGQSAFMLQSGDAHYYVAYDNLFPYDKQRAMRFRFISEMGFQSYPDPKTIDSFTLPEDRKPDSDMMYKHQKCKGGNQAIEHYMAQDFPKPRDFRRYVYASQILAGEVLKYAVEHCRRNRGLNMGVLLWQLNDCWPVVSWAGVDYYGRWKAQQYYTKRFFQPVLLSALDEGAQVSLHVTNDTMRPVEGHVRWALREAGGAAVRQGAQVVAVAALTAAGVAALDFSADITDENRGQVYLEYSLEVGGEIVSSGSTLFVKPKDFAFRDPAIAVAVSESPELFLITLDAQAYARGVSLRLREADAIFSDNFFDLSPGEPRCIAVEKADLSQLLTVEQLREQLEVLSVYDIG